MADTFLRIIPTDPGFVPPAEGQQVACDLLIRALPAATRIAIRLTEEVRFVDAGASFEAVSCPLCGAEAGIDWWRAQMSAAFERKFLDLAVTMPCCGGQTTLNDLWYDLPQGFARFAIEVTDPGATELPEEVLRHLPCLLGGAVRLIWANY
jgi:hypothetical protein